VGEKNRAVNHHIAEDELVSSQCLRVNVMRGRLKALLATTFVVGLASVAMPSRAIAQNLEGSIPQQFEEEFFGWSKDFYTNRSITRQVYFYLLPFTFPERDIARDAKNVNELYHQVLEQQVAGDRVIRTPDLTNPFNTSVQTLPGSPLVNGNSGSQVGFDPLPLR
jgi:hypothetical protein